MLLLSDRILDLRKMSVEAITWALNLRMERSSAKFVLVAMANCANNDMTCWPSIQYLSDATCQNRKTVQENIQRLKQEGYISDTTSRRGRTAQVIVYQLKDPDNGTVQEGKEAQKRNASENGFVKDDQNKQALKRNSSENGTLKEAQKWDSIDDETGPKTDGKRPENGLRNRKEPK
jgi:pyocin large subunit-like protein